MNFVRIFKKIVAAEKLYMDEMRAQVKWKELERAGLQKIKKRWENWI
jgi:hypothetical protein